MPANQFPDVPEPDEDEAYRPPEYRNTHDTSPNQITAPPAPQQVYIPSQPTSEPPAKRALWGCGGAMGCLLVLLLMVIIPAIVTAGTLNGGLTLVRGAFGQILSAEPPQAAVSSTQTIVNSVRPLGQLVSTSAQVAKADIEVNVQQGRFAACSHTANHVAQGTIEAGIDLLGITEDAVTFNPETNTYFLTVPHPVITSCRIDFIDQYERRKQLPTCNVDWDDARQVAQYEALVAFRTDAIEGGLLQTAERDAQFALNSFVSALTGANVIVQFNDDALTLEQMVAACQPEPPRDWSYDPSTRTWTRMR